MNVRTRYLATTLARGFNADLLELVRSGTQYVSMPSEGTQPLTH